MALERMREVMDRGEMLYTRKWAAEMLQWEQLGVYNKVAEILDLQDGDRHLDMGSGVGYLLTVLYEAARAQDRQVTVVGVERSTAMTDTTTDLLHKAGVPLSGHMASDMKLWEDKDGRKFAQYYFCVPSEERQAIWPETAGIVVIQDDIRSASVLRELLGDRKMSSASLMFPGVGPVLPYQAPYVNNGIPSEAEINRRVTELSRSVRQAAFALATELVETDGQFVVVERISKPKNASSDAFRTYGTAQWAEIAGNLGTQWDMQGTTIMMDANDVRSPVGWFVPSVQAPNNVLDVTELEKRGNDVGVFIARFKKIEQPLSGKKTKKKRKTK